MAINPITSGRTAPVDANGVLDCLVKQPVDNQPYEDANGLHLEECYKGSYDKLKDILGHIWVGEGISAIHSTIGSVAGTIEKAFDSPTCPVRDGVQYEWIAASIRVEEAEAGDHGFLYLTFDGRVGGEDDLVDDPYQDIWSMSWQAYSVDPYNFLSGFSPEPYPCSPSFDTDPENAVPGADHWTRTGSRAHVDKYLNGIGESKKVQGENYYYYAPDAGATDYRLFLNGAEGAVLEKKMLGRSATYHYPVLVHQTVKKGSVLSAEYSGEIGGKIDYIVDLSALDGCPYTFPTEGGQPVWTFVKIGDDMNQVKTRQGVTFSRRETYAGFKGVDKNFYGDFLNHSSFVHNKNNILSGRWELQKL